MNTINRRKFIKLGVVFVAGAAGLIDFKLVTKIKSTPPLKAANTISFEEWQDNIIRQIAASFEVPYDLLVREHEGSK